MLQTENWVNFKRPLFLFNVLCYHHHACLCHMVWCDKSWAWQWSHEPRSPCLPALWAPVVCIIASSGCVCPLAWVSCVTRDPHRDSVTLVTVWNIGGKLEKYVKHQQPASAAPGYGRAAVLTWGMSQLSPEVWSSHLVLIIQGSEIFWIWVLSTPGVMFHRWVCDNIWADH